MLKQEKLTIEEKIKLLCGKSGDVVAEKYGEKYFSVSDGPHGIKKHGVCYPNMCLVSSCWDTSLLYAMGESIGYNCNEEGVDVLLGPSVNIKRNPLCGRNFEYISEDPFLAGTLGAAYVNGVQSTGASACVKHYCCYNQETNRFTQQVYADEDVVMNTYVRVFKILLQKSSPDFLMSSYNSLNGEFVSQNAYLLGDVLRDLLGFKGVVISDWGGADYRWKSLKAGVDIHMPGDLETSCKEVHTALVNGNLTEADLECSLKRVLTAMEKTQKPKKRKETERDLLHKIAIESIVLLKNDENTLPIAETESLVVIGALAKEPCIQGGGCAAIDNIEVNAPYGELSRRSGKDLPYAAGYSLHGSKRDLLLECEAVERAKQGNVVVFFAGLPAFAESEGYDRKTLALPENQLILLEKLATLKKKIIVVLTNGAAVELGEVQRCASAIVECWYAGEAYAAACCDILFGKANPCGRLSESFPLHLTDYIPSDYYVDEKDCVRYKEGEEVGYKYYVARNVKTCYPFGYGLSYTEFVYDKFEVISTERERRELLVRVTLRNIGSRSGKEVVQVYLQHETERAHSLAGFIKTELQPGESKTVEILLDAECFTSYNSLSKKYALRTGTYTVSVRKDAERSLWAERVNISDIFQCTRYTKIGELLQVGNGPELVSKYLSPYICKAAMDDAMYHLCVNGREIDESEFLRNLAYSFPLYIFTTLTAGMLTNQELDEIIAKINKEFVFE